jgi:integrase
LSYQALTNGYNDDTSEEFWAKFEEYLLKSHNKHTTKTRLLYSKKYYHILEQDNAQELLTLSDEKRMHIMKALATLSKYLGCYDKWKNIVQRYQLKWSNEDSVQIFHNITNIGQDFDSMISWLKDTITKLPISYGNILLYNALTGLRPNEACESIRLLKNELCNYLKEDSMILEHYKYPQIFIRRTKKAYISIVTDSILDIVKEPPTCSYNALRLAVKKRGLDMNMSYCRKIFATHLRANGIEQEIIDLLQGRTPKSVFVRHYYRPDFNYDRIRDSLIRH